MVNAEYATAVPHPHLAFVFKVHFAIVICHWLANGFHALIAFIMFAIIILAAMALACGH